MKKAIIISENNKFVYDNFYNNKDLDILCIFAIYDNYSLIKDKFKNIDVFPLEDFERCFYKNINLEFKNKIDSITIDLFLQAEILSYKVLEFYNPGGDKFSPREMREAYYSGLNFSLNLIDYYKPDGIIFTNTPHSLQTIILSKVCEIKKIKFIFKREITLPGIYLFQDSFQSTDINISQNIAMDDKIKTDTNEVKKLLDIYIKKVKEKDTKSISKIFSVRRDHFLTKNNLMKVKPFIIGDTFFLIKQYLKNIPKILLRFLRDIFLYIKNKKEKNYLYSEDYYKVKNIPYKDSKTLKVYKQLNYLISDFRKLKLLRYYNSITDKINFEENFIYFPLHYQPEATTYPFGNQFIDQTNAIRLLAQCLPENYFIYVKEHPDTFNISHLSWTIGDFSRDINFYNQIKEIDKVKLLPFDIDLEFIIKKSKAVATLTGAVGLEFILNRKFALLFGSSWYDNCEGALKCNTFENCSKAVKKIVNNYSIDENKVKLFFKSSIARLFVYNQKNTNENISLIKQKLLEKFNV